MLTISCARLAWHPWDIIPAITDLPNAVSSGRGREISTRHHSRPAHWRGDRRGASPVAQARDPVGHAPRRHDLYADARGGANRSRLDGRRLAMPYARTPTEQVLPDYRRLWFSSGMPSRRDCGQPPVTTPAEKEAPFTAVKRCRWRGAKSPPESGSGGRYSQPTVDFAHGQGLGHMQPPDLGPFADVNHRPNPLNRSPRSSGWTIAS